MTTFLILTFIISLAGIAILLFRKVAEIEKYASIEIDPEEERGMLAFFSENSLDSGENVWDLSKINEVKNMLAEKSMRYGHELVLWLLKIWIKAFYLGKKQKKIIYEKAKVLARKLFKLTHGTSYPILSENKVLKQVANYKSRLVKIARKMKEQEEKKHIEEGL